MFGVCELGQRMTNGFGEIDDEIEAFNWYLFPYEIQKILTTILIRVQMPIELQYFDSISATRENSKKVSFKS